MDELTRVPPGIDPTVPSVARMYDYYLGGKDNFPADREAAEQVIKGALQYGVDIREMAKENRWFLGRTVRYLAEAGVRQFIDIGTGLPTQENVHQVAQKHAPGSRVVYVDNDPIVLVHARALLAENSDTIVLEGDLRDPDAIFDHPDTRAHIDFSRPFAVLLVAVLHFITDDAEAARIIARIRERMIPGCHLVLTHAYRGASVGEQDVEPGQQIYAKTSSGGMVVRNLQQISSYFEGLEILEPGIVPVEAWRPDVPWEVSPEPTDGGIVGGVGRLT